MQSATWLPFRMPRSAHTYSPRAGTATSTTRRLRSGSASRSPCSASSRRCSPPSAVAERPSRATDQVRRGSRAPRVRAPGADRALRTYGSCAPGAGRVGAVPARACDAASVRAARGCHFVRTDDGGAAGRAGAQSGSRPPRPPLAVRACPGSASICRASPFPHAATPAAALRCSPRRARAADLGR